MRDVLAVVGGLTVGIAVISLVLLLARIALRRLRRTWFAAKTCSRNVARLIARHEDRYVRVVQLGSRVSLLVDLSVVSPAQCDCPRRLEVAASMKAGAR